MSVLRSLKVKSDMISVILYFENRNRKVNIKISSIIFKTPVNRKNCTQYLSFIVIHDHVADSVQW